MAERVGGWRVAQRSRSQTYQTRTRAHTHNTRNAHICNTPDQFTRAHARTSDAPPWNRAALSSSRSWHRLPSSLRPRPRPRQSKPAACCCPCSICRRRPTSSSAWKRRSTSSASRQRVSRTIRQVPQIGDGWWPGCRRRSWHSTYQAHRNSGPMPRVCARNPVH